MVRGPFHSSLSGYLEGRGTREFFTRSAQPELRSTRRKQPHFHTVYSTVCLQLPAGTALKTAVRVCLCRAPKGCWSVHEHGEPSICLQQTQSNW